MASAALLAFLFSWNEFLFAYSFTATEASRTVPVALALFPGVFEVPWGDIAAASLLVGRWVGGVGSAVPAVQPIAPVRTSGMRSDTSHAIADSGRLAAPKSPAQAAPRR